MSTYCISDIHGCFDQFIKMLNLINFQESDELYILGDIIDRGPKSAEMLWWAIREAPANVHFLLGNHEDMMNVASEHDTLTMRYGDSWSYNYGFETIQQIVHNEHYFDGWMEEILDWSRNLSYFYDINVRGCRFVLVHAGLQSKFGDCPQDSTINGQEYPLITIEDAPLQNRQAIIWDRTKWIADKHEWPFDVVCGHTPTCSIQFNILKEHKFDIKQESEGKIAHINGRKHLIDCGVNRGYYLGCLRLDDMVEFYVNGISKD